MNLRHSVRGLLVDHDDNVLLYRFAVPSGLIVWTPPGGGIDPGESLMGALARELEEETGLKNLGQPTHVWHQEVVDPALSGIWDGVINDYYLIRTTTFDPSGSMSKEDLAAEQLEHFEWWSAQRLLDHRGPGVFGPRELPRLYNDLIHLGRPTSPITLGL